MLVQEYQVVILFIEVVGVNMILKQMFGLL